MGAYHTIELELNRKFTLAKKVWDSVVLDRIGTVQHYVYFYRNSVIKNISANLFSLFNVFKVLPCDSDL